MPPDSPATTHPPLRLLPLILSTLSAGAVGSPHQPPLDELDTLPQVLTPSRIAQAVDESPAAVTIISRQKIRQSGIRDIAELFRLVPGMFVVYPNHQLPQVKYHGLDTAGNGSSRHLQVLIDGRSIYQSGFSRVLWGDTPLLIEDIERIEVVRSPSTVSHGTNAFMGVINIITRAPEDSTRLVTLSAGTQQRREMALRHVDTFNDIHYRLSLKYAEDGGFDQSSREDGKDLHLLNLRSGYQASAVDRIELDLGYKSGEKEDQSASTGSSGLWSNHYQNIRWIHDITPTRQAQLTAYHQRREVVQQWDNNSKDLNWHEERYHIELQHNQTHSQQLKSVVGGTLRHDRVRANTYFGDDDSYRKNSHQLYTNLEWRPSPPWVLHGGMMWDHEDVGSTSTLSPRAALNYHLSPNHTLRANYSQATRSPDLLEQYAYWRHPDLVDNGVPVTAVASSRLNELNSALVNHQLQPEEITAHELGWHFHLPQRRLQGDIKLYQEALSNLTAVTLTDSAGTPLNPLLPGSIYPFTHSNLEWARIRGVELESEWRPTTANRLHLSYSRIFSYQSNNIDLSDSSPREIASAMLTHRFDGSREGAITLYYAGGQCGYLDYQTEYGGCAGADYTPPLRRLDLSLNHNLSATTQLQLLLQKRLGERQLFNNQNSNRHSTSYMLTLSSEW